MLKRMCSGLFIIRLALLCLLANISATGYGQCISGNCVDGTGSAVISPEIIYTGSFKNGLPDGKGIFYNKNFKIYDGDVKNGLYNGTGTLYYENGSIYIGGFKNGLREGPGEYRTLKEIFKGNFHLNGFDKKFIVEDTANSNGIYSVYGPIWNVYMGADKIGVYRGFNCNIFDAHTGQLLEITPFPNSNEPDRNLLYLDFGTRCYDTARHRSRLPLEMNSFIYRGKSIHGDPVFSQSTFESINIITLTANNEIKKEVSIDRDAYKLKSVYVNAVAPDLSRLVVNGIVITPGSKQKIALDKVPYNAPMVFSPGGDSLKIYGENGLFIFSALTGKQLSVVKLADLPMYEYVYYSNNFYTAIRNISSQRYGMIFVENIFDNSVMPLINPDLTYAGATAAYEDAQIQDIINTRESREQEIKRYEAEMAYKYGDNWHSGGNMPAGNVVTKPVATTRKCSFCRGSGVINIPGSGTSLEQDRTSGRWYKVIKSDNGECPLCGGKGYITR